MVSKQPRLSPFPHHSPIFGKSLCFTMQQCMKNDSSVRSTGLDSFWKCVRERLPLLE